MDSTNSSVTAVGTANWPIGISILFPLGLALFFVIGGVFFPEYHKAYVEGEAGFLELGQVCVLLAAIVAALLVARLAKRLGERKLSAWSLAIAAGMFFVAGEELSWGQHLAGWSSPEIFLDLNKQNETNFHNMTSFLNEKPRALLRIAVIVFGIAVPIYLWITKKRLNLNPWWLWPTAAIFPTAVISQLVGLPDTLRHWSVIPPDAWFYRESELQELFYYWFGLVYFAVIYQALVASISTEDQ